MGQPAGGLAVCHQENLVRHGTFTALGRLIDFSCVHIAGFRHGQRGGSAAVQTDRRHTTQLNEALCHLCQRGTYRMAALASIDGIENQGAVFLLANSRTGACSRSQAGNRLTVLHQGVEGAHGILYIVPLLIRRGETQHNLRILRDVPQCIHMVTVGLQIDREHHLIRLHDRGISRLQHAVHGEGDLTADCNAAIFNRAKHIHAGLGVAGVMAVIEIIGIQVDAAGGYAGLVDTHHLTDNLGITAAVIHTITQVRHDGNGRFAENCGSILLKAHRMISRIAAAQLAVGYNDTDGQTVAHIVKVAVDTGYHAVAFLLQLCRRLGHGVPGGQHITGCHDGYNILIGCICDEILSPQIRVRSAPEHIGGELGLLVQHRFLLRQIITQRLRRCGRHSQPARQRQR